MSEATTPDTPVSEAAPGAAPDTLTPTEYREMVLASVTEMSPFPQPLLDAVGLSTAEDVYAPQDSPSFDHASKDGYAVRAADVANAARMTPSVLPVVGTLDAGSSNFIALAPNTTARIMAGAPLPKGADTVVPHDWTDGGTLSVQINRSPDLGQFVRRRGEETRAGDLVLPKGTSLEPRHAGLLASLGRSAVSVHPRPRVVIIATGSELRDPGQDLAHDSIYDSDSYLIAGAAKATGAIAYRVGIVKDDPRVFLETLHDQLVRADVVVTTGGVSASDFDVVKATLGPAGVWFGEVAMQPGRLHGFGLVGEDAVPLFALPGNPVSAYVGFELFVRPALRKLMGLTPYARPTVTAVLSAPLTSLSGRQQYLRGRVGGRRDGSVSLVGGLGSHLIGGLARADCLVVVPPEVSRLEAGAEVQVIPLESSW